MAVATAVRFRSKSKRLWFVFGGIILTAFATYPLWFRWLGEFLITSEAPVRADLVVVLAGDYRGLRILKAAELVKQGFAPRVLVSGPNFFYGQHECDVAIPFAVRHGYPEQWFQPFPHDATSTDEEAGYILRELRRTHIRNFLLVTSDYHTARARRIFRRQGPEFEFRTIAAQDAWFTPSTWWHTREGRKVFFFEWSKTVATAVGL